MQTLRERARAHYRALRRLEVGLGRIAVAYNNGTPRAWSTMEQKMVILSEERINQIERDAVRKVSQMLDIPQTAIFINWDSRGHAIKVREYASEGLPRDWGMFGCPGMKRDIAAEEAIDAFNKLVAQFQEWYRVNHLVENDFGELIQTVRLFIATHRRED